MYKQKPKTPTMAKMLGDLNKDGKMSSWETARQNAIEKNSPAKKKNKPSKEFLAKREESRKKAEENALKITRENREKRAIKAEKRGDFELARRIRSQGEDMQDKEAQSRISPSPATMKEPRPLTKEQKDKANKARLKEKIVNKVPTVAKKTIGPEGSKKTQRIRAKVQKNEDKLFTTPINTKKEERLFKKDERLQKKLRKSKEKDKVKSVAKNYKKGYYGV